jgi:hypothetical protein
MDCDPKGFFPGPANDTTSVSQTFDKSQNSRPLVVVVVVGSTAFRIRSKPPKSLSREKMMEQLFSPNTFQDSCRCCEWISTSSQVSSHSILSLLTDNWFPTTTKKRIWGRCFVSAQKARCQATTNITHIIDDVNSRKNTFLFFHPLARRLSSWP